MSNINRSLKNSYYNEKHVSELVEFWSDKATKFYPFIPATPSIHTYKALEESKPEKKVRHDHTRLQKWVKNGFSLLEKKRKAQTACQLSPLVWETHIEQNLVFQTSLNDIRILYKTNQQFQRDVKETTSKVLVKKILKDPEASLEEGKEFLLKELAFLIVSPVILKEEAINYVYHQEWPILNNLLNGVYNGHKVDSIGLLF